MKQHLLLSFLLSLSLLCAGQNVPSYVPTNGLVGWWPFNGNANDESGNGNHGTANGATLTSDRFGNINSAYEFLLSKRNYITSTGNNLSINAGSSTLSIWFSPFGFSSSGASRAMLCYGKWTCNQARYIGQRGGSSSLLTYAQYCNDKNATFNYELNKWYHFVATYENNIAKLYLNSEIIGSYSISTPSTAQGNIFWGCHPNLGDFFDGKLDDAAIWDRALSQDEISKLYKGCDSVFSSIFYDTACHFYVLPWEDTVVSSGNYEFKYRTLQGCDSIVVANIKINSEIGTSLNLIGTAPFTLPWGETVNRSGYYSHTYQNIYGCDSLVTAYVVVNLPPDSTSRNIGVNISNPQRNLHINDAMRLEPRNSPLDNPTMGDMYFDANLRKLRVYDGSAWQNCW